MSRQPLRHPIAVTLILCLAPLWTGCSQTQAVEPSRYSPEPPPYTGPGARAGFSAAQLDSLLAPIALYPDSVLSHLLIASTYPLEVVEADRWARNNPGYEGDAAVRAVESKNWDPSVKALVAFPTILQRMSSDLDWTQQLGDAFLANETGVMDSIQNLRNRAYDSGTLDEVEHVRVIREERTIVIEPSVERVVYVPAYDTRVVYGHWWWPDYPPVYWRYPSSYVFVSGFYWGPRVHLGPHFYFSGVHWHQRRVVVVDRHHHHRFYNSRSLVRHSAARHWHHNPVHRRGVAYRDNHTRERFNSPRESYQESHHYRAKLRTNSAIVPNNARDQRQGRDEQFQQRLERKQAGSIGTNNLRERSSAEQRQQRAEQQQPRAERLRERLHERSDNRGGDNRGITNQSAGKMYRPGTNQAEEQQRQSTRAERREHTERTEHSPQRSGTYNRQERNQVDTEPARMNQPSERTHLRSERTERGQRTEQRSNRMESPRSQRIERTGGDNRASMRGERER